MAMTPRFVSERASKVGESGPGVPGEQTRRPAARSQSAGRRGNPEPPVVDFDGAPAREPARRSADPPAIRVLVADDHPILREGLATLINRQSGMQVVAEAADGIEAVALFGRLAPDVSVIDIRMPGLDGIEAVAAIRAADPQARIVILTSFANDEDIYRALQAGARGYIVKDAAGDELVECLRAVHQGRTYIPPAIASKLAQRIGSVELTAREREVLALVAKGKGNRDIGAALEVTEGTIKVHVNNILTKLNVASRTEAVNIGVRRGLVRIDD
jgi:DNA-binding NarL/FixJ family response regulator